MKLSMKIKYALACIKLLSQNKAESLTSQNLSSQTHIPSAYATKILQSLARHGIIAGKKGAGYSLIRPVNGISLLEILNALCSSRGESFPSEDFISEIESKINKFFNSISIGDFLEKGEKI